MEACVEDRNRTRRRRRRRRTTTSSVLLWGILVFAQFGMSSSSQSSSAYSPDQYYYQSYPSPRKAGPFHETTSSVSFTGPRREEEENRNGDVYKDDKRLVHTGPNPLHN